MKIASLLTLLTLGASILHSDAQAQTTAFTYQGRLSDSGTPANGTYEFRFELRDAVAAGASVGTAVTNSAVAVSNGVFTVTLDFGASAFTGPARWLEIGVRSNGVVTAFNTLTPRQPITAAPYAVYAMTPAGPQGIQGIQGLVGPQGPPGPADASAVLVGTLGDARLSGNVALLNATNAFTGTNRFTGMVIATNTNNQISGVFTGNGAGLTNLTLPVANLVGTLTAGQIPALDASKITSGTFDTARLTDGAVTAAKIANGSVVRSVNGLSEAVTLAAGANVTLTPSGNTLTIAASGGGGSGWSLTGNSGLGAGNFLGSTDNQPLELRVNGTRALRLEPNTGDAPNVIGGSSGNYVSPGTIGATIGGGGTSGSTNQVTQYYGTISGGVGNTVDGLYGTIAGGTGNTVRNYGGTIAGGVSNSWSDYMSSIGGGNGNAAYSYYGFIGGGRSNVLDGGFSRADYWTISGGWANFLSDSSWCGIGGGRSNSIWLGQGNLIGGGQQNTVGAFHGGAVNFATISGGILNAAFGVGSSIDGGSQNTNSDFLAVTMNGSSSFATIAGGLKNLCYGDYAMIPGGNLNFAQGTYSFAAGRQAKAIHGGAFVWADSTSADFSSTSLNEFSVRATGGIRFATAVSGANPTAGVSIAPGSGTWTTLSDRNAKEHFAPVDAREVLEKVAVLPVLTWNYKTQDASIRHIGPTAQDFKAAFSVGETNTGITTVDADGVALAAIQGLNEKLEAQVKQQEAAIKSKADQIQSLEKRLADLEQLVRSLAK